MRNARCVVLYCVTDVLELHQLCICVVPCCRVCVPPAVVNTALHQHSGRCLCAQAAAQRAACAIAADSQLQHMQAADMHVAHVGRNDLQHYIKSSLLGKRPLLIVVASLGAKAKRGTTISRCLCVLRQTTKLPFSMTIASTFHWSTSNSQNGSVDIQRYYIQI